MGIPLRVSPVDWPALLAVLGADAGAGWADPVTDTARLLAPMLVRPPLPLAPGWAVDLLALPGLAMLPPRIRDGVRHPVGRGTRALGAADRRGVRLWTAAIPVDWRSMPQARAAERRVRARRGGAS